MNEQVNKRYHWPYFQTNSGCIAKSILRNKPNTLDNKYGIKLNTNSTRVIMPKLFNQSLICVHRSTGGRWGLALFWLNIFFG
mmetsp:Transcript_62386/g.71543  ORF Transcript_62386/g.71543 Transcript_62386/m.71543 type:complete len:82 (+) Transcript_62386:355-600(+)